MLLKYFIILAVLWLVVVVVLVEAEDDDDATEALPLIAAKYSFSDKCSSSCF